MGLRPVAHGSERRATILQTGQQASLTARLESKTDGAMNLHAPQSEPAVGTRAATMKFTYPSGSTPLDGYTIKRGVGRGGFGEVYYGTSDAGKEVALKLIRRNLDVELRGVRHCLNLKHPNLVALYDIKADDMDDRWVVMEYVSGESLEDAIDRNPNGMPEEEVLRWIHGLCAGVAYLHDHGIVHRDLKPGNIFCDEGVVKVGDYGLSKFISCSRRSGQTESVGTVHYMAPEISNGRYGREIDTYAIGIILYEMLTGQVPFEGESVGEVLMKHLTAEPDLSVLGEPYREIVQKALTKDPDGRLRSVAELAGMLPPAPVGPGYVCHPPRPAAMRETAPHPSGAVPVQPVSDVGGGPQMVEVAEVVDAEEPILAGLRNAWQHIEEQWREADLPPLVRIIIIVASIVLLVSTAGAWVPLFFVAFFLYGFYWLFRKYIIRPKTVRHRRKPPEPPAEKAVGSGPQADGMAARTPAGERPDGKRAGSIPATPVNRRQRRERRRRHVRNLREHLADRVANKPFRLRLTELTGSMLYAAVIAFAMSLVVLFMTGGGFIEVRTLVWYTVVGTLGAWAVMIPSKFAEGKVEDQAPMRFIMLLMGLMVGAIAGGLTEVLMVDLPYEASWTENHPVFGQFGSPGNLTSLGTCIVYFGSLFVILRWWLQTNWTRHTRLSLWSVVCCVFWAYLVHVFWRFPQPAGMMVAAVMAVTIQLASPWLPLSQRRVKLDAAA